MNEKFIVRDVSTLKELLPGARLEVFNKWGSRVFLSESYENNWGGEGLSNGLYYYTLKAGCGEKVYMGWIQIVR